MRARRLVGLLTATTLALSGVLSGCSGSDEPKSRSSSASTPTASSSNYLDVPEGVTLTPQGSELHLRDQAVVAYEPRQDQVAVLKIAVTKLEKASFDQFVGWELDKQIRRTTPYFVHARIENYGRTDLGGKPVPLYIVDGTNKLIEASSFTGEFKPCEGSTFPKKFGPGDSTRACLVYLSPDQGELTAVSFRPTQKFDPIVWTGEVTSAKAGTKKAGTKKSSDKKSSGKKSSGKKSGGKKKG